MYYDHKLLDLTKYGMMSVNYKVVGMPKKWLWTVSTNNPVTHLLKQLMKTTKPSDDIVACSLKAATCASAGRSFVRHVSMAT
jgi:hypothetical protein